MKKLFAIIIGLYLTPTLFAQTDTVFMNTKSGLFSEFQIIYPQGKQGIQETYSFFKNRYWLVETDTISLETYIVTENGLQENKSRKPKVYEKYSVCDTTINLIRNSASYWKMMADVNQIARDKIGYDNKDFNAYQYGPENHLKRLSHQCYATYKINEELLQHKLIAKIKSIQKTKQDRFIHLKNNSESIHAETISKFLSTFNQCNDDLKSLEIIILNQPKLFLQEVEKLDELDFYTFTFKLGAFHKKVDLNKMKATLNQCDIKTSRKKKIIRKLDNKSAQS